MENTEGSEHSTDPGLRADRLHYRHTGSQVEDCSSSSSSSSLLPTAKPRPSPGLGPYRPESAWNLPHG
ncbi:unnamed protein product [Gadus morhua 'NCC']